MTVKLLTLVMCYLHGYSHVELSIKLVTFRILKILLFFVHQENEKSRDIIIEQRFHKSMIGAAGGKIKEIRDKFNQVQITFPDPGKKSDVVSVRGPKSDVDKAYKYLTQMHQEMVRNKEVM